MTLLLRQHNVKLGAAGLAAIAMLTSLLFWSKFASIDLKKAEVLQTGLPFELPPPAAVSLRTLRDKERAGIRIQLNGIIRRIQRDDQGCVQFNFGQSGEEVSATLSDAKDGVLDLVDAKVRIVGVGESIYGDDGVLRGKHIWVQKADDIRLEESAPTQTPRYTIRTLYAGINAKDGRRVRIHGIVAMRPTTDSVLLEDRWGAIAFRGEDGHLAIAKFPRKDDEINTVVWEAVALSLAQKSGIPVPQSRVENIAGKPVLLLRRFDRDGKRRIPFLSAMSMLGSKDRETRSYLEIVDALRQHGAAPQADMEALWRRLVFNILISNTDDHLRNHGFLYEGQTGWRLSPAYDLNPVPTDIKPRILSTAINENDNTASLALAVEVAAYFELDDGKARDIAKQVGKSVSKWRDEAARHGLTKNEIDRMASAFEHEDLGAARKGVFV